MTADEAFVALLEEFEPAFPNDDGGFADPLEIVEEPPADQAAGFELVDLDDFLAAPPAPPDWDWHGYYARGDVVLIVGDPGVGKSLNEKRKAIIAATGGGEHLGEQVAARRVLFVDLESPDDVVHQRLIAFGVTGSLDGFAYVHRPAGFNLADSETLTRLRATIAATRADTVVLDSLRRGAPGLDENDSRAVSIVFTALREIAAALGCTIIVLHHPRKPIGDAKIEALYAARGSGDLTGSVDSYLFIRRLPGGLCRIEHGKARRGREHEPICYRILEGDQGEPVIEHVPIDEPPDEDELLQAVVAYVTEHPGAPQKDIEDGVKGSRAAIRRALEAGASHELLARGSGRHHRGKYWYPANHAASHSPGDNPANTGDNSPPVSQGQLLAHSPAPRRGGESEGEYMDNDEIERLAALAEETLA